ncbi:MAG TPA: lasso peptide biosynthesis B2 protein [Bryobacteraceae bacterium]|jgi:hypothetical protein
MKKLLNFARLTREEQTLFLMGIAAMTLVRIGLLFRSVPRISRFLAALSSPAVRPLDWHCVRRRLVQAGDLCDPFLTCLSRTLAARALMARYGYSSDLCIGVLKSARGLRAHAWLEREGEVIIGSRNPAGENYVRIQGAERLVL